MDPMRSAASASSPAPQESTAHVYIGRQPIVDRERMLVAFELLFRAHDKAKSAESMAGAAARVIVDAFTEFSIDEALGPHRALIKIDRELLMSDLLAALPSHRIVLELVDTITPDNSVIRRCSELRGAGYRLALDNIAALDDSTEKLLPYVSMVKLDVAETDDQLLARTVPRVARWPVMLIAEKVETPEQQQYCLDLGFHLFQGYHFAHPEILRGKRAIPDRLALLRLLQLLMTDAHIDVIENELKQHPDLAYNIMRIANSAAYSPPSRIASLAQCVAMLGREKLLRWAQLLIYASGSPGSDAAKPLMQLAATRGKWMENLAVELQPHSRKFHDLAFMVGILSLLGVALGMPLDSAVSGLNLEAEAKSALLEHKGPLARLLQLIVHKEHNDFQAVARALQSMPYITPICFAAAELRAAAWAQSVADT